MYEWKNPVGAGRAAIAVLWAYLAMAILGAITSGYTIMALEHTSATFDPATADQLSTLSGALMLCVLVVSMILVARWIYRVNANAHTLSDEMEMSPGWNIGWFFVPIANLWKPFSGMSQTWRATHYPGDMAAGDVPGFMRLWWGLWLTTNVLGNLIFRLSLRVETAEELVRLCWLEIVTAGVDVVLALTLIHLIRQLTDAQKEAADFQTFA